MKPKNELLKMKNSKKMLLPNKKTKTFDIKTLDMGFSLKFRADTNDIKIVHSGKNFKEIEYAIFIIRNILYLNVSDSKVDSTTVKKVQDKNSDDEEFDFDAFQNDHGKNSDDEEFDFDAFQNVHGKNSDDDNDESDSDESDIDMSDDESIESIDEDSVKDARRKYY